MSSRLAFLPDYSSLHGPAEYSLVESDEQWDSKYLEFVEPDRIYTFGDFEGIGTGGPTAYSEMALTTPFRMLSDEGVAIVQRILEELEPYAITSERTPAYLPGSVYRSQFLRGFYADPSVREFLSGMAQVSLDPFPVPYQALHVNYAPKELGQTVDQWHTDSVSFDWVMMVSDPREMKGGNLQQYLGVPEDGQRVLASGADLPEDQILTVSWPGPGWFILQQGHRMLHRVTPLLELHRRMTMVGSYYTAQPGKVDPIDRKPLNRLREEQDRAYTLVEWSRHHALRAAQSLQDFADTKARFDQPLDEVKHALHASISDIERVLAAFEP